MIRTLFRVLRVVLDVKAASKGAGPLGKRLVRRRAHRQLSRVLRKL